jgi:hypothetical protein
MCFWHKSLKQNFKLIMKLTTLLLSALVLGSSAFAQIPGMMTTQISSNPEGTALGANETLTASGIALGNRVKMRGYIDFILGYDDEDIAGGDQNEQYTTQGDIDFLFDLSPVTAEAHIRFNAKGDNSGSNAKNQDKDIGLEQLFARYNVNDVFNFSFGRQLTALGYEADEAPGLYAVTNAYVFGSNPLNSDLGLSPASTRRNYVEGIRANFNNGQFGLTFGLHDGYWSSDNFDGDNLAIDLAASVMIIPGLEARLGYAHEEIENGASDTDISQFNMWLGYNPNDLTLAIEYDNFDILEDQEYWSLMLLASYQFTDWFAATLRYSHEDYEIGSASHDADRFTFAFLFSITDNFGLNLEYSTTDVDSTSQGDYNEFYIEGLLSY